MRALLVATDADPSIVDKHQGNHNVLSLSKRVDYLHYTIWPLHLHLRGSLGQLADAFIQCDLHLSEENICQI